MSKLVDTNLIIRFLTEDDPNKAKRVAKLLGGGESLVLPDIVFAQTIWVLQSFYKLPKHEIAEKLGALLEMQSVEANRRILHKSLEYFTNYSLEFIDAYQAAYCEEGQLEGIYSYDEDFDKIKSIKRFEP